MAISSGALSSGPLSKTALSVNQGLREAAAAADSFTATFSIDNFIDFDGFETYGPAQVTSFSSFNSVSAQNNINNGSAATPTSGLWYQGLQQNWLSQNAPYFGGIGLITGLNGIGTAIALKSSSFGQTQMTRNMPSNYSRIIMGFAFQCSLVAEPTGVTFNDGGTSQACIYIDTSGRINIARGSIIGGTVLYTSSAVILANVRYYLEIDLTIHPTAGAFQVWLNGTSLTSASSQNTRSTTNNYVNQFTLLCPGSGASVPGMAWDDMYWRDNTHGSAGPVGDCMVEAVVPSSDYSVQFSPAQTAVGPYYAQQAYSTGSGGANSLTLVPVTPIVNLTINSVAILPAAINASAKFKGVIYSDASGNPGSLLSSGTEVVGCNLSMPLTLPLVTPQALTGNTQYWIGYITDTSVALEVSDIYTTVGQFKANTYTSGAPAGPLSGMTTGQNPWCIWGIGNNTTTNFQNVSRTRNPLPPGLPYAPIAYNSSSSVGKKDLFNNTPLSSPPNQIFAVKVAVLARRSDPGPRTMNIKVNSFGFEGKGANFAITPSTSLLWYSSRFNVDPGTGGPWGANGVNNMKIGYEVNS